MTLTQLRLKEQARQFVDPKKYDVIVCGAGPAGVSAAISAAREGMKTLLIESQGSLGGVWTSGLLCLILDIRGKGGLLVEIENELERRNARLTGHRPGRFTYDVETMKVLLDELCTEAGVDIRLHTRVVAAIRQGSAVQAAITEGPGGREAFIADVFVDATGNGDFAAQAQCSFDYGHPETGHIQPATMFGIVSGVPPNVKGTRNNDEKLEFRELLRSVGIEPSYQRPSLFRLPHPDLCCLMINHEFDVHSNDAAGLTEATIRGRKEVYNTVNALRNVEGWENMRLVTTAAHIGLREGRRIRGMYEVTVDDIVNGKQTDDAVCIVRFGVDIHAVHPSQDEIPYNQGIKVSPYAIPLRSLIARDADNVMMAGRCVSGDFFAHSSYRVTGNAVPMGEAAGIAAALSIRSDVALKQLDGRRVRRTMSDRGYDV